MGRRVKGLTARINGETWYGVGWSHSKKDAQFMAERERKRGHNARVIKKQHKATRAFTNRRITVRFWGVYRHPTKKRRRK